MQIARKYTTATTSMQTSDGFFITPNFEPFRKIVGK